MMNLGDFSLTDTVYVPFTTYDSSGGSVTISGLAVTDIEIYKNGSTTQRASDAGYALLDTDGIDFDSITGLHGFSVDLSDDTDSGFFANGSQYWLVVSAITVDSETVTFAYYFTVGKALATVNAALDTAIAELSVGVPTATPSLRTGLMLLYMALRNKTVVQTSGTDALEIYNDAGDKIASKAITDDGSDYTEAEMA
jgi:hypothetical protein